MAFSGVHIAFGYTDDGQMYKNSAMPLPFNAKLSQSMSSPTISTIAAPPTIGLGMPPLLSISASAPIFYATGKMPDASGNGSYPRRYYDPAQGREDIFVDAGDKFAWIWA